jgi:hypothetical protein
MLSRDGSSSGNKHSQCRWRRMYLCAEHERRRQASKWRRQEFELLRTMSYLRETIDLLHVELQRGKGELRSHMRAIERMKQTLTENDLPIFPVMMSLRLCTATDDTETCPLAIEPINQCAPPFEGCCLALNPLKPEQRCAELECGHRFNGVWLMFHFVRNRTFRCPVCRRGKERFRFDPSVLPACMVKALEANGMPVA